MVPHLHGKELVGIAIADRDPVGSGGLREGNTAQKDRRNQKRIDSIKQREAPPNLATEEKTRHPSIYFLVNIAHFDMIIRKAPQ
jgi:hypothetical protein